MPEHLKPESPDHVRDAVRWAVENKTPIELIGHGSKRAIGRPGNTAHTLDVSALSGVSLYEPAELVLSAGAGTASSRRSPARIIWSASPQPAKSCDGMTTCGLAAAGEAASAV